MNLLQKIKYSLFPPKVDPEVAYALLSKLPNTINVEWKRDGRFIIGVIDDGSRKYTTQAYSAKEFIDMVNDAIYTVYEIPQDYLEAVSKLKAFVPPLEVMEKLNDGSIKNASFSFQKVLKTV